MDLEDIAEERESRSGGESKQRMLPSKPRKEALLLSECYTHIAKLASFFCLVFQIRNEMRGSFQIRRCKRLFLQRAWHQMTKEVEEERESKNLQTNDLTPKICWLDGNFFLSSSSSSSAFFRIISHLGGCLRTH